MRAPLPSALRLWAAFLAAVSLQLRADTSALWGTNGELWDPAGRLPDFSHAGYHQGEVPLPSLPPGASVKSFGAIGDGVADDTAAFLRALASVRQGAVEVPAGRYRITDILEIKRSGIVLRGAGPDKTVLFFPRTLQDVKPDWSQTTEGRRTSNYSWSGGFVWFRGDFGGKPLAAVTGTARRGATALRLDSTSRVGAGQQVEIFESDQPDNSLAADLYSGDPGDTGELKGSSRASLVCRIVAITGDQIQLDRPLRFNIKPEWKPRVLSFEPTVSESGVENLAFEFPDTPYRGHFTEFGFNAVAFTGVANCWARDLRILNADSGVFPSGCFCTIQNIVIESGRAPDTASHCTGHHGIYLYGDDNLFTGFDFRTRFIHDITVSEGAGNVIAAGRGVDLCFDHHKRAPCGNLFVNLDAGAGSRLWRCGGGAGLGKNCAEGGTFWNIRAAAPLRNPPADFGPASLNLVALQGLTSTATNPAARWIEGVAPAKIEPQDLHAAQLARRLQAKRP